MLALVKDQPEAWLRKGMEIKTNPARFRLACYNALKDKGVEVKIEGSPQIYLGFPKEDRTIWEMENYLCRDEMPAVVRTLIERGAGKLDMSTYETFETAINIMYGTGFNKNWTPSSCLVCFNFTPKFRCGNCKIIKYCCRACQVVDWPTHKTVCDKIKEKYTGKVKFEFLP